MNKEYTLIVNKNKSILNRNLVISTLDNGIDILFNILDCPLITLESKNLYSQICLLSPLQKKITTDIAPIINNTVVFTLKNGILDKMEDSGQYELYIIIYDDKLNRNVLPPIICEVEQSKFTLDEIQSGVVGSSVIDYSRMTSAGNVIKPYNADGSYNATNYMNGDLITEAKLNKNEIVTSKLVDDMIIAKKKIKEMYDNQIQYLHGEEINPTIISDLPKGFYVLDGYYKDFENSVTKQLSDESYIFVTACKSTYSKILRCDVNDEDFQMYKYDKNIETIYLYDGEVTNLAIEEGYIGVKNTKVQRVELTEAATIVLPDVLDYCKTELWIYAKSSNDLTFPQIVWSTLPTLTVGRTCKIELEHIGEKWYGNAIMFG